MNPIVRVRTPALAAAVIRLPLEVEPILMAVGLANYSEQVTWRDAGTGDVLAESDFFEPLTINSLTPPGFGGRVYFPTAVGNGFYILQPMPAAASQEAKAPN
jgi:hypothetical protein